MAPRDGKSSTVRARPADQHACTHHGLIKKYQKALAEARKIDDSGPERQAEFKRLVAKMNEAIAATYPDATKLRQAAGKGAVQGPQLTEKQLPKLNPSNRHAGAAAEE